MNKRSLLFLILGLSIITAVIARLVDHPMNFAPIGAVAVLSGYYLRSRVGWAIPLLAMLVSDAIIGFYHVEVLLSVYASYVIMWGLGRLAFAGKTRWNMAPAALLGSSVHFLLTNFAVWAFTPLYQKTAAGLMMSYTMAIPFFQWTVLGDLFYTTIFIVIIESARFLADRKALGYEPERLHQ